MFSISCAKKFELSPLGVTLNELTGSRIDNIQRHSGLNSLKLEANSKIDQTKPIGENCLTLHEENSKFNTDNFFKVKDCDCIKTFEPTPGEYVLGVWIKKDGTTNNSGVIIEFTLNGGGTQTLPRLKLKKHLRKEIWLLNLIQLLLVMRLK
jgi:hypothetical protein